MLREDVLAKNREGNYDEGFEHTENQGLRTGYTLFAIVYMCLALFDIFLGDGETHNALNGLFWIFMATRHFSNYRFTKNKLMLFVAILDVIISITSIVTFVAKTLR